MGQPRAIRLLLTALLAAALLAPVACTPGASQPAPSQGGSGAARPAAPVYTSLGALQAAFRNRTGKLQVTQEGVVFRVLPDDKDGSRHQRFLVRLASGQTLLFAHNIDLAKRIPDLKANDRIVFCGEYAWNDKGGVIHWTHRDPAGKHPGGWLLHKGKRYE